MDQRSMEYVPYGEEDRRRALDALLSSDTSFPMHNGASALPPADHQPRYNHPPEYLPLDQNIKAEPVSATSIYQPQMFDYDCGASPTSNSATSTTTMPDHLTSPGHMPPHQYVEKDQGISPNSNFEPITITPVTANTSDPSLNSSTVNAQSATSKKPQVKPQRAQRDEGERRRKQLREAQRNYRQRKETRITALEYRVQELESLLQTIQLSVSSVGNDVVNSNALDAHPDLRYRLSEAMQMCKTGALLSNKQPSQAIDNNSALRMHHQNTTAPMLELIISPAPPSLMAFFDGDTASKLSGVYPETTDMSTFEFMNALQASSIYLGYMVLASPATTNATLSQYFFLPMGLGNRQFLTAYFAARFHAKISRKEMPAKWANFPFLRFGGAGRHFLRDSSEPDLSAPTFSTSSLDWPTMDIADEIVSQQSKGKFAGEWFDLMDLELFLQNRKIKLVTQSTKKKPGSFSSSSSPPASGSSEGITVDGRLLLRDLRRLAAVLDSGDLM